MRKISLFGAAAILVTAAAFPSMTQAAGCAQYDPGCATYPMPKKEAAAQPATVRADVGTRSSFRAARAEQRVGVTERSYVTGGPVRAAGAVAAGAVATAGAIATAPVRATNSYAYYDGGWDRRSYAERNGFVCTPGELFKGFDGRIHVCQ